MIFLRHPYKSHLLSHTFPAQPDMHGKCRFPPAGRRHQTQDIGRVKALSKSILQRADISAFVLKQSGLDVAILIISYRSFIFGSDNIFRLLNQRVQTWMVPEHT